MTEQAVQIIITVVVGQEKQVLHKDINEEQLESAIKDLSREVGQAIFRMVLQMLDDQLQKTIPKTWKNVGRVIRKVTLESGYVIYRRRIYRDDRGPTLEATGPDIGGGSLCTKQPQSTGNGLFTG